MRPHRYSTALLIVVGLSLFACSKQPPLVASDVVINEALPGQMMTAGYLTLRNNSDAAIRISSVSSPEFGAVEMHETQISDGIARMRAVDELVVAPQSSVKFERGGLHLMLMRPSGDRNVSLNFYQGDALLLSITTPVTPRDN